MGALEPIDIGIFLLPILGNKTQPTQHVMERAILHHENNQVLQVAGTDSIFPPHVLTVSSK